MQQTYTYLWRSTHPELLHNPRENQCYMFMKMYDFLYVHVFVSLDEGSLYLKAMAYGIDKVLDVYRQKLVIVERKVRTIYYVYVGLKAWICTIHGLCCSKHGSVFWATIHGLRALNPRTTKTEGCKAWIWAIHGLTWTKHGFAIAVATTYDDY